MVTRRLRLLVSSASVGIRYTGMRFPPPTPCIQFTFQTVGQVRFELFVGVVEEAFGSIEGMAAEAGGRSPAILGKVGELDSVDTLAGALSWTMYSSAPVLANLRLRNWFGSACMRDRQIGTPDKAQRIVV